MKLLVISVFLVCYILILMRRLPPLLTVYLGVLILLFSKAISLNQALNSININVLGVFLGTMVLSRYDDWR